MFKCSLVAVSMFTLLHKHQHLPAVMDQCLRELDHQLQLGLKWQVRIY